jgi:hypothetical protein
MPFSPGYVKGLTVWNGELIVGGFFQFAGGVTANSIARWNGASWQPFGIGTTGLVYSWGVVEELTVWNGDLIAGGEFSAIDGVPLGRIGRYDGASWQPLGSGYSDPNDPVYAFGAYQGALFVGGYNTGAGGIASSPNLARWSPPVSFLSFAQPAGPGSSLFVLNGWRTTGHEYFNVFSFEPAPGGLGTGPYGGLFFANPALLIQQLQFPAGFAPFHVIAGVETETYGPYPVAPGLYLEAISADVTGGVVGCISAATGYLEL